MIFLSSGHNSQSKTIPQDPGAVNKHGVKEGDLTIEFKHLVAKELDNLGAKYETDTEEESLKMYLNRIQTGKGSVVIEYHFDASDSELAGGSTVLIQRDADRLDQAFAKELLDSTISVLGTKNRGVISEAESHRGTLGLMREQGIVALVEICFITNASDLALYELHKNDLAAVHAGIIIKYEAMIQ